MRSVLLLSCLMLGATAHAQSIVTTVPPVVAAGQSFTINVGYGVPICASTTVADRASVTVNDFTIEIVADFTCDTPPTLYPYPLPNAFVQVQGLPADEYLVRCSYRLRTSPGASYGPVTFADLARIPVGDVPQAARLERVSGDRQIVVNSSTPPAPYVVRALDANGNPVRGVQVLIGPAAFLGWFYLQDEFRFRGFNASGIYGFFDYPNPEYVAVTDRDGLAAARGHYVDGAPSAFPVQARVNYRGNGVVDFSTVLLSHRPPGSPVVVVEYFHPGAGHYFNTLLDEEVAALDSNHFAGWQRSTGAFAAYASADAAPSDAVPVCRFFSEIYTSHFYTANADECDEVVRRWTGVWMLETRAAYYIQVPDKTTGACPLGTQPVYRMYNNRPIPNHRYVTDAALRDRMTGAGWRAEGYGPQAVAMCAPA